MLTQTVLGIVLVTFLVVCCATAATEHFDSTRDLPVCNKLRANSEGMQGAMCQFVWSAPVFLPRGCTVPTSTDLTFRDTSIVHEQEEVIAKEERKYARELEILKYFNKNRQYAQLWGVDEKMDLNPIIKAAEEKEARAIQTEKVLRGMSREVDIRGIMQNAEGSARQTCKTDAAITREVNRVVDSVEATIAKDISEEKFGELLSSCTNTPYYVQMTELFKYDTDNA